MIASPPTIEKQTSKTARLPARISDVAKPWAELLPDHPALVETSGTWTYGQLTSAISATQTWLCNGGVRPGDRIMIVGENCREFVALLLASAGLDAWPVLVNARLSPREVDEIRDHCGARRVLYTTKASPHAAEHAKRHGAPVEEVNALGSIGVGALNLSVEPEPIEHRRRRERCRPRRRLDLHLRHHRPSQRRHADPPEPAVSRGRIGEDSPLDS